MRHKGRRREIGGAEKKKSETKTALKNCQMFYVFYLCLAMVSFLFSLCNFFLFFFEKNKIITINLKKTIL